MDLKLKNLFIEFCIKNQIKTLCSNKQPIKDNLDIYFMVEFEENSTINKLYNKYASRVLEKDLRCILLSSKDVVEDEYIHGKFCQIIDNNIDYEDDNLICFKKEDIDMYFTFDFIIYNKHP